MNTAVESQIGSGDTQSVTQTGDSNDVVYSQIGNNLPDLAVKQTGGMTVTIVQTR